MRFVFYAWFVIALFVGAVHAQTPNPLMSSTQLAKDLRFPAQTSTFSAFSTPEMAMYKPEGPGPFPALVLQHQCGGLKGERGWINASMLEWARKAVAQGYVVLLIDSLSARGVSSVCMGAKGGVNFARGVRDTLQAAEHLRQQTYVDPDRIAMVGFSWGGMNAILGSSTAWGEALAVDARFKAAVAFYPGCYPIRPANGNPYEIVRRDIDRPLLVLMGSKDTETPPEDCISRLEPAKTAGAPVEWHVYENTTHCWDCKNLHNYSKVDLRGTQVVYHFDEGITQDSERRMFDFLSRTMPPKPKATR